MFIAALFTIVKLGKQLRWSSIDEWIKNVHGVYVCVCDGILLSHKKRMKTCHLLWCVCVCVMEYYSAIKKNKNLTFATVWKNLGDILPSEIRQTEKNKYCMIFLICGI